MDEQALAEWFGANTRVVSVDTAIQAKDRFDLGERVRLKQRAAFVLAEKLIESGFVATTVIRGPEGDIIRVQVQCVNPEIWCEGHERIFTVPTVQPPKAPEAPVILGGA